MATFQTITTDKKQYIPLLLLAAPCEAMIDRYLEAGDMHVLSIGDAPVCVAVVSPYSGTACELKNLATDPQFQKQRQPTESLHLSAPFVRKGRLKKGGKRIGLFPASTTAMFMGTPCSLALAKVPLMIVLACTCVMSPGSWSLLTSTPANAMTEKARTIRPDKRRRRMKICICCDMGKVPHPTEHNPAFRFALRYPLAPFSARHYIK